MARATVRLRAIVEVRLAVTIAFATAALMAAGVVGRAADLASSTGGIDLGAREAAVEGLIKAASADPNTEQRDKVLAEATGKLAELIELVKFSAVGNEDVLRQYRLRIRLVEVAGLLAPRERESRLASLQATAADRKALAEMLAGPADKAEAMVAEIDTQLGRWRADLKAVVTVVPQLEDLLQTLAYKSAWIHLYYGMALEDGPQRQRQLKLAITLAEPFARGAASSGVKHWSLLLCGRAYRELGRYEQTVACLASAGGEGADQAIRKEAMFESVRNAIEQARSGAWSEDAAAIISSDENVSERFVTARKALDAYEKFISAQPPQSVGDQLKIALLRHLLYQTMSTCPLRPDQARKFADEAQGAIAEFIVAHPDWAFCPELSVIIAEQYGRRGNVGECNSAILIALTAVPDEVSQKSDEIKLELLKTVLERKDDVSVRLAPQAFWQTAMIQSRVDKQTAAGSFFQLATEYGGNPLARSATINAVVCYNGVIASLLADKKTIPDDMRSRFITALELLLGRWGSDDDVAGWHFDLGAQYQKLAELSPPKQRSELLAKAADAYEKTPASSEQYIESQRRALEIRYLTLSRQDVADPLTIRAAELLVKKLWSFAVEASAATAKLPDGPHKEEMRGWGAWADFTAAAILYDVLGRRDEALANLRDLPGRWAGTSIVAEITEFEVRKLAEQGRENDAAERALTMADDFPLQAGRLGQWLALRIRQRLTNEIGKSEDSQLDVMRKQYLQLARLARDKSPAETFEQDKAVSLLLADALLENGQAEQALETIKRCQGLLEEKNQQRREDLDSSLAKSVASIKAAGTDKEELLAASDQFFRDFKSAGAPDGACRSMPAVKQSVELLRSAEQGDVEQQCRHFANNLQSAYAELRQWVKSSSPEDADLLELAARATAAMKRYGQAAVLYRRLVDGLDKSRFAQAYWRAEYAYCESLLKGFDKDKAVCKGLAIRIAQLKTEDPAMGGLAEKFQAIRASAEARSK